MKKLPFSDLEKIIKIMQNQSVSQLLLEENSFKLKIQFETEALLEPANIDLSSLSPLPEISEKKDKVYIKSAFVGLFSSSPNITEGCNIKSGETLGYVKSVGVDHEIKSPCDGIIVEKILNTGSIVQYGSVITAVAFCEKGSGNYV